MSNLTSKNYIETMLNNTKHYDYEPMYFLTFVQNSCFSEILVNDIPVHKNFEKASQGLTLDINNYIFKSGIQKVTFRLYPAGKRDIRNFSTLVDDTKMKIEITEADNKNRDTKDKEIITYITPLDLKVDAEGYETRKFKFTGQKYVELSFTFNATVPYEFNTLNRAEDLSKWDKDILEKRVVSFYKNQWNILNEKREDDYFSFLELKEKETRQSLFCNKQELQEILDSYTEAFTIKDYNIQPLDNYELKLYGDGKLVCLELKNQDKNLRGESALWAKYDKDRMADFLKFYIYMPKGGTEFEIVR